MADEYNSLEINIFCLGETKSAVSSQDGKNEEITLVDKRIDIQIHSNACIYVPLCYTFFKWVNSQEKERGLCNTKILFNIIFL